MTTKSVKKGEIVSKDNTWVKRPGNGEILATEFFKIQGKSFKSNLDKDHQLKYTDIQ